MPSWDLARMCWFYFGMVGCVVCWAGHPAMGFLRGRFVCWLGMISYGLYVYHPLVITWTGIVQKWMGIPNGWWIEVTKLGGSLAAAAISWKYLERPILAWKDQFGYQGRTARSKPIGRPHFGTVDQDVHRPSNP